MKVKDKEIECGRGQKGGKRGSEGKKEEGKQGKGQGKDRFQQMKPCKNGRSISYISRKHLLLAFVSALHF